MCWCLSTSQSESTVTCPRRVLHLKTRSESHIRVTDMDLKQVLNTTSVLLVDNTYAGLKDTTFSKYLLAEMLDPPLDATAAFICDGRIRGVAFKPVSYTHLTLPTNSEVYISEVAVSLKK